MVAGRLHDMGLGFFLERFDVWLIYQTGVKGNVGFLAQGVHTDCAIFHILLFHRRVSDGLFLEIVEPPSLQRPRDNALRPVQALPFQQPKLHENNHETRNADVENWFHLQNIIRAAFVVVKHEESSAQKLDIIVILETKVLAPDDLVHNLRKNRETYHKN